MSIEYLFALVLLTGYACFVGFFGIRLKAAEESTQRISLKKFLSQPKSLVLISFGVLNASMVFGVLIISGGIPSVLELSFGVGLLISLCFIALWFIAKRLMLDADSSSSVVDGHRKVHALVDLTNCSAQILRGFTVCIAMCVLLFTAVLVVEVLSGSDQICRDFIVILCDTANQIALYSFMMILFYINTPLFGKDESELMEQKPLLQPH
jgi:hypothetical protein